MVTNLLKKGIPYEIIETLSEEQITVILAVEQAIGDREAEEQARQSQSMRF